MSLVYTNAVKYFKVHPNGKIDASGLDRETIWVRKGNTAASLDQEEVFYPEHEGYQVGHIVRGEE